jgi:hypothetical protein
LYFGESCMGVIIEAQLTTNYYALKPIEMKIYWKLLSPILKNIYKAHDLERAGDMGDGMG